MSLALYRKYRPGSFAEVVGQEHVTGPLRSALANGRLHHAYLFSGPRGCGKTSSARILARSLNCEQGPTPEPCGVCDSCVALAPNGPGSLDVIEIDAATHNGVDDARDLRERAFFAPVSARFKVYIIDEAHMVTAAAFNALLKLVEEPPEFVKFVFATTEPEKVLTTIRSRTHHYPFRLVPRRELTELLASVVEREGVPVEDGVLSLVVRAAAGSARDGLSILDQVLAAAGPDGVRRDTAAGLLGVTPDTLLDDVVDAFAARDAAAVFATVDKVMEGGHDPRRFTADVLERFRDLIVLDAVPDAGERGLLDHPSDQLDRMARQAAATGTAALSRAADLLHDGLVEMRGTTAPRLLLELLCARVLLPAAAADDAALLTRLERLERRLEIGDRAPSARAGAERPRAHADQPVNGAPAARPEPSGRAGSGETPAAVRSPEPARPDDPRQAATPPAAGMPRTAEPGRPAGPHRVEPAGPPAPQRSSQPAGTTVWPETAVPGSSAAPQAESPRPAAPAPDTPPPGGLDAAAVRRVWDDVLRAVRTRSRPTQALLAEVSVAQLSGRTLTLAFQHAPLMRQFQSRAGVEVLKEALQEVLGADLDIECTAGQPAAAQRPGNRAAAPAAPEPTGFAPGDEPVPDDQGPAPAPALRGEDAALRLVQQQLGGRVLGDA